MEDIKDFAEAILFVVALVAGSFAAIVALIGLAALFFYLVSIIIGVPIPTN